MQEKSRVKQPIKARKSYTYQADQPSVKKHSQCPNCQSWQQKAKDLIWGYEELINAKQTQIQTLNKLVSQLDSQKIHQRNQRLQKKNEIIECQIEKCREQCAQSQKVIKYYKQRQVSLVGQLKSSQIQLFNKNILIQDEMGKKQVQNQVVLEKQRKNDGKGMKKLKKQQDLIPILRTNESLGRLLQKSLIQVENMGRDKLLCELKHRMTMLKAVQLSVLK